MTFVRTKLGTVEKPLEGASIIQPNGVPAFKGEEQENLLCGGCELVIGKSVSATTLKARFAAPVQLVVICPKCKAYNVLPSTLHVEY